MGDPPHLPSPGGKRGAHAIAGETGPEAAQGEAGQPRTSRLSFAKKSSSTRRVFFHETHFVLIFVFLLNESQLEDQARIRMFLLEAPGQQHGGECPPNEPRGPVPLRLNNAKT